MITYKSKWILITRYYKYYNKNKYYDFNKKKYIFSEFSFFIVYLYFKWSLNNVNNTYNFSILAGDIKTYLPTLVL